MTLAGIRDAIKTALTTITSLKAVYDTMPESIGDLPAVAIAPRGGTYHSTFDSTKLAHSFELTLFIPKGQSFAEAQDELDAYIAPSGASSILAAVEAANLSGHADSIMVMGYRDYGGLEYAGLQFIGCKFDIEVLV